MNIYFRIQRLVPLGAVLVAAVTIGVPSASAGPSSARSMAMGEAFTSLAMGVDAARFNPANLGLDGFRRAELELVGVGLNVNNNAFSLDDYNNYTGAFLTDADKADILNKVPDQGLSLSADAHASAMALSAGPFVIFASGVGQADVNLNKDIVNLLLNGNTFGDSVSVTGSYSDAIGYAAVGASYGLPLYTSGSRQFAVGITGKYIRGLAIEQIVEMEGLAATFAAGFEGEGRMIARTATGGSGYGVDLGAALKFSDNYTAGVRISNVLSSITWDAEPEEHSYIFSFDTVTVDNMDEDFVVSESETRSIESFSTTLPSIMNVGFANTTGKFIWGVDWQQGFRRAAGSSTKPRIAVGAEWSLIPLLPLRAGYAAGGDRPSAVSVGSGLDLGPLYIDFAAVTGTSISPYSTKGVNVAFSTGLTF